MLGSRPEQACESLTIAALPSAGAAISIRWRPFRVPPAIRAQTTPAGPKGHARAGGGGSMSPR